MGLANAPIVETKFLELAMSLLDFSPRIPLGTFSILPFSDSHAPILTKLVGDRSATDRGLVGDFAGTCLRPNQSQPGFCASTKTWLRLIWSQRGPRSVADFSATSPGPIGDLVDRIYLKKVNDRSKIFLQTRKVF